MKKREDELVHIKLEYDESVQAKGDILSLEMSLINLLKIARKYKHLRIEELNTKLKFYKKIKDTKNNLRNLHVTLPKMQVPKITREEEKIEKIDESAKKVEEVKRDIYDKSLEVELQEIKEKLALLQKR